MLTRQQSEKIYREAIDDTKSNQLDFIATCRELALHDLYFLLVCVLNRKDLMQDWTYDRCREVQLNPNGMLDLWAREHNKSSVITFGLTIFDLMKDPEATFGIFSFSRTIAKDFLQLIKYEFEENQLLRDCFPDVLWENPRREAPIWSINDGIVVKRKSNPRESSVEAWGLVDSQPTGKHFKYLVYDDVVTKDSVNTPEMIQKTTAAWEMSLNLGKRGGFERYIGTRYHYNDTYRTMIDRDTVNVRKYAATANGQIDGEPVLLTRENLAKKYKAMGIYTFGSQMLQDPIADKAMGFKIEWVESARFDRTTFNHLGLNIYLLCDPASSKKKNSDFTAMAVIGLGPDKNYYLLDGVYDRLNLTERARKFIDLHRKYRPIATGYEKYGKDSDIEHIEFMQAQENYRFRITPMGGRVSKNDRILSLVPIFEHNRFWLPHEMKYVTSDSKVTELMEIFINNEYLPFPVGDHDDFFDCLARINDPDINAQFPYTYESYTEGIENAETEFDVLS